MESYFQNYIRAVESPLPEMRAYFDAENDYLKNLIASNSSALDVGCGNGRTMKFLAPLTKRVVGIDYDADMILAAKNNLDGIANVELILGDFLTYSFSEQFDLVYASYNLLGSAETEDKQQLMKRMLSVAKPNSHVLFSVWSSEGIEFAKKYYPSIGIKISKVDGDSVITDHGVFRRFAKNELEFLFKDTHGKHRIITLTPIFYLVDIRT